MTTIHRVVGKRKTVGQLREMLAKFRNAAKEIHNELDKYTDSQLAAEFCSTAGKKNTPKGLDNYGRELHQTIYLLEAGRLDGLNVVKQVERLKFAVDMAYDSKFIGVERGD